MPPLVRASSPRAKRSKRGRRARPGSPARRRSPQLHRPSCAAAQHDVARAVAQRVVDQVAERLLQAQRVGVHRTARSPSSGSPARRGRRGPRSGRARSSSSRASTGSRRSGSSPSPERATTNRSSASCARWSHSSTAAESAAVTAGSLPPGSQGAFQLGLDHRHRRSQLVAGVGDEAALALERAAQALEHLVQRLPQPPDLVVRRRQRQPVVAVAQRHLSRAPAHRLDRPQPGGGKPVAEQRRDQHGDRPADGKRRDEAGQRLVAIAERLRRRRPRPGRRGAREPRRPSMPGT